MKQLREYLKKVLLAEALPVWLTLLVSAVGFFGLQWLAPQINQEFEKDRVRSDYVISNLSSLNSDTGELLRLIKKYGVNLSEQRGDDAAILESIDNLVIRLQWRVVEFEIIFPESEKRGLIENYSNDLNDLVKSVERAEEPEDYGDVLCWQRRFLASTHKILSELAYKVDLRVSVPTQEARPTCSLS